MCFRLRYHVFRLGLCSCHAYLEGDLTFCDELLSYPYLSYDGNDVHALINRLNYVEATADDVVDAVGALGGHQPPYYWSVCGSDSGITTHNGVLVRKPVTCCGNGGDAEAFSSGGYMAWEDDKWCEWGEWPQSTTPHQYEHLGGCNLGYETQSPPTSSQDPVSFPPSVSPSLPPWQNGIRIVRAVGDATVVAGVSFVPEVYYSKNRQYYPICGHYFWDSDGGATLVCSALGFQFGGTVEETRASYTIDAMPVGRCNTDEHGFGDIHLEACTGGGNGFGDLNYNNGWCRRGSNVGIRVVCTPDPRSKVECTDIDGPSCLCSDECPYAADLTCDDGGDGSEFAVCLLGQDCSDCGKRSKANRAFCNNDCSFTQDGECDDGGPGADFTACKYGTDCDDCGSRAEEGGRRSLEKTSHRREKPAGVAAKLKLASTKVGPRARTLAEPTNPPTNPLTVSSGMAFDGWDLAQPFSVCEGVARALQKLRGIETREFSQSSVKHLQDSGDFVVLEEVAAIGTAIAICAEPRLHGEEYLACLHGWIIWHERYQVALIPRNPESCRHWTTLGSHPSWSIWMYEIGGSSRGNVSAVGFVSAQLVVRECPIAVIKSSLWYCLDLCPRDSYFTEEDWHFCLCSTRAACNLDYLQEMCHDPKCQSKGECREISSFGLFSCSANKATCPQHRIGDGFCDSECYVSQFQFDGGDCEQCSPGCDSLYVGDGRCDGACNTRLCNYDKGDCIAQCKPGCSDISLGDGFCDGACNNEECQFDQGDCGNLCAPGCQAGYRGDSFCDRACNNEQCDHDFGDCAFCDGEMQCPLSWIGDGICDPTCDIPECSNDHGDCSNYSTNPVSGTVVLPYNCSVYVVQAEAAVGGMCNNSFAGLYSKFEGLVSRVARDQTQQEYVSQQQDELNRQKEELHVFIAVLEANATALEEAKLNLAATYELLDKQFGALEAQKGLLEQETGVLSSERDQLVEDTIALNRRYAELQGEKVVLENDKQELQHDKEELLQQAQQLQEDKMALENDKTKLEGEKEDLLQQAQQLQDDKMALENDKTKLEGEKEELLQQAQQLQDDKSTLKEDATKLEVAKKVVERERDEIEQEREGCEEIKKYLLMAQIAMITGAAVFFLTIVGFVKREKYIKKQAYEKFKTKLGNDTKIINASGSAAKKLSQVVPITGPPHTGPPKPAKEELTPQGSADAHELVEEQMLKEAVADLVDSKKKMSVALRNEEDLTKEMDAVEATLLHARADMLNEIEVVRATEDVDALVALGESWEQREAAKHEEYAAEARQGRPPSVTCRTRTRTRTRTLIPTLVLAITLTPALTFNFNSTTPTNSALHTPQL
jgi:hypothetical protein